MLKIGNITLSSPCILAPLSGISDLPFRMVNRSLGCELAFVPMISARSIVYQSRDTKKMLSSVPSDRPLGIQLLGNDPHDLHRALKILQKYEFDIIDFNAACPVNKVTGKGKGASLLKEPLKLRELLKIVVDNSHVPVTVKIRSGWDDTSVNARDIALYAQDAGVKGLFIHGRTRVQGYRGRVDYKVIRKVKDALEIPVIASGDAFSPQLIRKMFDETGCDGVVIARGALGNPWIFRETKELLENGTIPERPALNEIINTMLVHLKLCADYHGEVIGTMLFRKFFAWYTKGFPDIKPLRDKAFCAETREQMEEIIKEQQTSQRPDYLSLSQVF